MAASVSSYPVQVSSGVTTSWLPIASAWPSISQCSSPYWYNGGPALAFDPSIGASNTLLQCLPPAATLWWDQSTPTPLDIVTSLGPLLCPSGYYVASQTPINSISTLTACCPLSYTFETFMQAGAYGECKSFVPAGSTWQYYTAEASTGPWTLTTSVWTSLSPGIITAPALNGYNFAPSSISTSSSSTSSTTSSSNPASTIPNSSTGLSTGAKAGIGIGVSLSVLGTCLALGAVYFIRRHVRKSTSQGRTGDSATGAGGNYGLAPVTELEGERYTGIPGSQTRLARVEMDAGGTGDSATGTGGNYGLPVSELEGERYTGIPGSQP